jgi:hypothetical protein
MLRTLSTTDHLLAAKVVIDAEFARLLSKERRELIKRCLELRFELVDKAL